MYKRQDIGRPYAAVSFTITTADDEMARKLEPNAPTSSERFKAMKILSLSLIHIYMMK